MNVFSLHAIAKFCAYLLPGALAGFAYLLALRWNVALYMRGRISAVVVHGLRVIALAVILGLFARAGAEALISALAGFELVRFAGVRRESIMEPV